MADTKINKTTGRPTTLMNTSEEKYTEEIKALTSKIISLFSKHTI